MDVRNVVTTAAASSTFGVFLGPVAYAVVQGGLLAFNAVCAANFIAVGVVYHILPATNFGKMLSFYSLTLEYAYFRRIGIVHFAVGALHVCMLVSALASVLLKRAVGRHLKQQATSIKRRLTIVLVSSFQRDAGWAAHPLLSRFSRWIVVLKNTKLGKVVIYVYTRLLAPRGFFGVESNHFETLFLVREIAETVLQAFQAYQMSRLLPRDLLNRFYVAILVLNCWSTPLLHRIFRGRNQALSRLLCLLCDIGLDFVSAVGVPVWLTLDYMADYDPELTDFPDSLWYNDSWLVQLMNDAPLIFLSSWLEAFSRLSFSLSMLFTLEDVKNLIKRKPASRRVRIAAAIPFSSPKKLHSTDGPKLHVVSTIKHRRSAAVVRRAHRVMIIFGVVILAIQIHAESKPRPPLCVLQVRPWLVSHPACALMEINCLLNPKTRTTIASIIDKLNTESLEHVVIRHCQRVDITPQIQSFHNLVGFKTYNVTLTSWGSDAAITQSHHPQLRFLHFVRTNFPNASLPAGLLSSQLPASLTDIEICGTNLNRLPGDLDKRWPAQLALFIEYGELTEYPLVLTKMSMNMISLCHNKITYLPSEAFTHQRARLVAFTGNPIATLPELTDGSSSVVATEMFLDMTNIAGPLPAWIDEAFVARAELFLGGTPFCVDVALNESSAERRELLRTRPWLADGRVSCEVLAEQSFYPLDVDVREDEEL